MKTRCFDVLMEMAVRLVLWYQTHARDLPWRRTRDPYAIWISEVMLQQTQVSTVLPYFDRWMKCFPSVRTLAAGSEAEVLKAWEGLGYYTRAKNLRKAAIRICSEHDGEFPRDFAQVLELPGIGRYTAGAICSIAFEQPVPIVDGNIARVLARLFALWTPLQEHKTQKQLWAASSLLLKMSQQVRFPDGATLAPSVFNQALMELGATICLPKKPRCETCPLQDCCQAFSKKVVHLLPRVRRRPEPLPKLTYAFVIGHKTKVLVRKRKRDQINGGLWEFPNFEVDSRVRRPSQIKEYFEQPGLPCEPFLVVKHSVTTSRITLKAFRAWLLTPCPGLARDLGARWLDITKLNELPFPSAHAQIRNAFIASLGPIPPR